MEPSSHGTQLSDKEGRTAGTATTWRTLKTSVQNSGSDGDTQHADRCLPGTGGAGARELRAQGRLGVPGVPGPRPWWRCRNLGGTLRVRVADRPRKPFQRNRRPGTCTGLAVCRSLRCRRPSVPQTPPPVGAWVPAPEAGHGSHGGRVAGLRVKPASSGSGCSGTSVMPTVLCPSMENTGR